MSIRTVPAIREMHVLNLTNKQPPFYRDQVTGVEALGVTTEQLVVPERHDLNSPWRLTDYIRFFPMVHRTVEDRFDLVHANYGLTAPMALSQRKLPVVLTLWGTDLYGPLQHVSRTLAPHCDAVIVMSEQMKTDLGLDATVIPHGVDLDRFVPIERSVARDAVGWDSDTYHVLFPYDTERPEKGYPRARRIVDAAAEELDTPVELSVVTGVPQKQFVEYLNAADTLLLTSEYEGSPNVVKEALACNLPVVSTDVGDVAERVRDVTPSTVASTDAGLVEGLVDILKAGTRSDGRDAVQDLSLERTSKRLIEVYEQVLEG